MKWGFTWACRESSRASTCREWEADLASTASVSRSRRRSKEWLREAISSCERLEDQPLGKVRELRLLHLSVQLEDGACELAGGEEVEREGHGNDQNRRRIVVLRLTASGSSRAVFSCASTTVMPVEAAVPGRISPAGNGVLHESALPEGAAPA